MSYDPHEPVEATLMRSYHRFMRLRAVSRITWAFGAFQHPVGAREERFGRLTRTEYGVSMAHRLGRPIERAPWGWRWRRLPDYDAVELMPLWLYWLVEAWDRRYGVFRLLRRMGLWQKREGALWTSGRLTAPRWLRAFVWCFLRDRDEYSDPRRCRIPGCRQERVTDHPLAHRYWFCRSHMRLYTGTWSVKNVFEVKPYARRLLVEGNVLEGVWAWDGDRHVGLLLKSDESP